MRKFVLVLGGLAGAGLMLGNAGAAPPAKLTMVQARAIALKAAPGRVSKQEYEKEKGGWRYSFDIMQGKRLHEIGVDANTGAIVENVFEKPGT